MLKYLLDENVDPSYKTQLLGLNPNLIVWARFRVRVRAGFVERLSEYPNEEQVIIEIPDYTKPLIQLKLNMRTREQGTGNSKDLALVNIS